MAGPPEPLFTKLKPGPGKSSQAVRANQRTRLVGATVELATEIGYEHLTVRGISGVAGVSTATFYKHFTNVDDCFAFAYESIARRTLRRAHQARQASNSWEEGLCVALRSLMEDAARHPKEARLVTIEAFAAGPHTQSRMRSGTSILEQLLSDNRQVARGLAAGLTRIVRMRVEAGKTAELPGLTREMEDWAISVYGVGQAYAAPRPPEEAQPSNGNSPPAPGEALRSSAGDERSRILNAVVRLSLAEGFAQLTAPKIRAQAGVSRSHFRTRFADVQECFLEAVETIAKSTATHAHLAARRAGNGRASLSQAIRALCTEAARNPVLARFVFVDVLAPGRKGLQRRERLVSLAAAKLQPTPEPTSATTLSAEASIASAWRIAQADLESSGGVHLLRLSPLIADLLLISSGAAPAPQ